MTTDVSVANQLTVSWAAPENQGHDDVSEYVVELRSSAGAMCVVQRRSVVTDLSALSVRFAGLPAGDYDISVIARNSVPSDSTSAASATGVTVSGRSGQLCVAVSASSGAVAENGGTKTVTVKLGRALTAGETVEVPLTIAGVGTDVFMLALDPVSQSGVVLSTDGSDSLVQPRLTFTTGAQTATLRYTSVANAGRGSPLVSVGFGTGARAPSATGIAGALLRGGTARFLVTDDETGAVPVPHDWALIPSGLGVGDQFRLLFKTSTARDATSTDIAAYDRFVQDALIERGHEALRPFIGDFKVLGSTQSAAARQRLGLGSSGPAVYWLNGARIAASHTVFCQEQRDGGWNEDDFHTGNIKIETGGSRSSIAAPFTGINNECRTRTDMGGLYLGSTGQVVAGAGGVLTSGDDAWSAGPLGESLVDPAGERPFYGLSPVFEVTPTLSLTVGGSASVTEGTDATFTVTADHAPSAAITVNYTVSQEGDFVSAGTRTLNFSGTTTTISVTTLDDKLIEPDGSVTVTLNTGQSYVVGSSDTATVTVTDDDTPAESATFTPSSVSVSENSGTASYTVVLDSRPTADVTVALSVSGPVKIDGPGGNIAFKDSDSLTFTTTNWDTAQTVRVQGQDDVLDNPGDERAAMITHDFSSSGDSGYNALANEVVSVAVSDEDAAPSKITLRVDADVSTTGVVESSVAEGGGPKTVRVTATITSSTRFGIDQSVTVIVGVDGDGATEGIDYEMVADQVLVIDAGAGSGSTTFTLTPVDDDDVEPSEELLVIGALSGVNFTGAMFQAATIDITDDDTAGLVLSHTTRTVSENSGEASYTVKLATRPSADVTVALSVSGPVLLDGPDNAADFTGGESLTFTRTNWDTAQTVRLQGVDDDLRNAGGSRSAMVTHDVSSSSDTVYNALMDKMVSVTVTDDDPKPTIRLSVDADTDTTTRSESFEPSTVAVTRTVFTPPPSATLDSITSVVEVSASTDSLIVGFGSSSFTVTDTTLSINAL